MLKSLSLAFALFAASSSAFAPTQSNNAAITSLRMSDDAVELVEPTITIEEPASTLSAQSQALPFMSRPMALDGSLAGDVGFDPLGFAKNSDDLMKYREAEVKHARLAMLAAAGWPLSEVFDKKIAAAMNLDPLLDGSDRVPSLLNGGLGKVSPAYWVACIGVAAMIDIFGQLRMKNEKGNDYIPGDFGLRLGYPADVDKQQWMQLAEIKNGRLAMIAVFGFAIQEFVSKQGVVDETPLFFFPIVQTLHQYANSGYIN